MSALIDRVGQKFGRLTVISSAPKRGTGKNPGVRWNCICDCGNEAEVSAQSLISNNTKSCGCLKVEALAARNGDKNLSRHPLYVRWAGMIQRCVNPNHVGYKNYGAKGVKVCSRWLVFENFLSDMGMPKPGESIDRIDSTEDYSPKNCKWATASEQSRNTSRNIKIDICGEVLTVRDWEMKLGRGRGSIQRRIDLGWPLNLAVTLPVRPGQALRRREI